MFKGIMWLFSLLFLSWIAISKYVYGGTHKTTALVFFMLLMCALMLCLLYIISEMLFIRDKKKFLHLFSMLTGPQVKKHTEYKVVQTDWLGSVEKYAIINFQNMREVNIPVPWIMISLLKRNSNTEYRSWSSMILSPPYGCIAKPFINNKRILLSEGSIDFKALFTNSINNESFMDVILNNFEDELVDFAKYHQHGSSYWQGNVRDSDTSIKYMFGPYTISGSEYFIYEFTYKGMRLLNEGVHTELIAVTADHNSNLSQEAIKVHKSTFSIFLPKPYWEGYK